MGNLTWKRKITDIPENEPIEQKINRLFDDVDELLWRGRFDWINTICGEFARILVDKNDLTEDDVSMVLGWLTVTLPAKSKLKISRLVLIQILKTYRPNEPDLWKGLE